MRQMDLICEYSSGDSDDDFGSCVSPTLCNSFPNACDADHEIRDYFNLMCEDEELENSVKNEIELLCSQTRLHEQTWELSDVTPGPKFRDVPLPVGSIEEFCKNCYKSDNSYGRSETRKSSERQNKNEDNKSVEKESPMALCASADAFDGQLRPLKIARGLNVVRGHSKAISCVQWNRVHLNYVMSSSFDGTIKIWNAFSTTCLRTLQCSTLGLNDCLWTNQGMHIVTSGFDGRLQLIDSESGTTFTTCHHDSCVSSIAIHPSQESLLLAGTKEAVCAWDLRITSDKPIHRYLVKSGQVLDIEFLGESEFICSTDVVNRESADRSIMAWDFSSGTLLSNQIFQERFTCPCLRVDPEGQYFLAQTHGGYIAVFSTKRPYRMNKTKCFKGHKLSGYGIQCDISSHGKHVITGDASGSIFIYNAHSSRTLKEIKVFSCPSVSVACHPTIQNCISAGSWNGDIAFCK